MDTLARYVFRCFKNLMNINFSLVYYYTNYAHTKLNLFHRYRMHKKCWIVIMLETVVSDRKCLNTMTSNTKLRLLRRQQKWLVFTEKGNQRVHSIHFLWSYHCHGQNENLIMITLYSTKHRHGLILLRIILCIPFAY